MKLVENILTRNPCYTAGRKITVKGLMLHSVGCPQPKASAFINSWNSPAHGSSCVHGFIDGNDGTVYQTLPWNHRGWHCGSGSKGSGNNTHMGVELFAMLCKKYSLDPLADGVVISHKEGYSRGIASNHGDPEHLWAQLGLGYTMDGFRRAVRVAMGGKQETTGNPETAGGWYRVRKAWADASSQKGAFKSLEKAKKCADENPGHSVFDESGKAVYTRASAFVPYMVRVSIPDLNIRQAPGTDQPKTGKYTNIGTFTIVDEADGKGASRWGLLKSYESGRDGWISLDYTAKV